MEGFAERGRGSRRGQWTCINWSHFSIRGYQVLSLWSFVLTQPGVSSAAGASVPVFAMYRSSGVARPGDSAAWRLQDGNTWLSEGPWPTSSQPPGWEEAGMAFGKGKGPQHCISSSQKLLSASRCVLLWASPLPCKAQDLVGRSLGLPLDYVPTATAFSAQNCRLASALGRPCHPAGSREGEGGCSGWRRRAGCCRLLSGALQCSAAAGRMQGCASHRQGQEGRLRQPGSCSSDRSSGLRVSKAGSAGAPSPWGACNSGPPTPVLRCPTESQARSASRPKGGWFDRVLRTVRARGTAQSPPRPRCPAQRDGKGKTAPLHKCPVERSQARPIQRAGTKDLLVESVGPPPWGQRGGANDNAAVRVPVCTHVCPCVEGS